jgi:hypothetical protein
LGTIIEDGDGDEKDIFWGVLDFVCVFRERPTLLYICHHIRRSFPFVDRANMGRIAEMLFNNKSAFDISCVRGFARGFLIR